MKILLLSPMHREYDSRFVKKIYGIPKNQGQASWVRALIALGHTVDVFIYNKPIIFPSIPFFERYVPILYGRIRRKREKYYQLNPENMIRSALLKSKIERFKPDFILISGGITTILPWVIKEHKMKVFLLSGVNPVTSSTALERKLINGKLIDLVVENDKGYAQNWSRFKIKTIVLPISSVDPKIHKKIKLSKKEKSEYGCDVCFVGSITSDRIKKLEHFTSFNFKFWGDIKPGVKIPKTLEPFYQGTAHGIKMIRIFNAAKIVLNFQPGDMKTGGNMRTFEIPGSAAFQLADRVDEAWFTDKKEVVLFSSMQDAVKKVTYYLRHENERMTIAENGFRRARKEHTYEKHFKKLLS